MNLENLFLGIFFAGQCNKTYSSEWGQAQVVDGTTSGPVVVMRDISVDVLLNPSDEVLDEAFDGELEISCELEDTDDLDCRAMFITSHLMTDPDNCAKLARKLFVKDDILKKGYPRKRRSVPRTIVPIDVEVAHDVELHNRFDILTRLLSGDDCHHDDANNEG